MKLSYTEQLLVSDLVESMVLYGPVYGEELEDYIKGASVVGETNAAISNIKKIKEVILTRLELEMDRKEAYNEIFLKCCTCCGEVKENKEFYYRARSKDKLSARCKECSDKTQKKKRSQIYHNNFAEVNKKKMRAILQLDLHTGEVIATWPNVYEVERKLGFNHNAVRLCCQGKTRKSKGFKWKYADEINKIGDIVMGVLELSQRQEVIERAREIMKIEEMNPLKALELAEKEIEENQNKI